MTITITEAQTEGAVTVTGADGQPQTDTSGIVSAPVENVLGFSLPITGGTGTMMFSVIGIVMMGLGVMILLKLSRRSRRTY